MWLESLAREAHHNSPQPCHFPVSLCASLSWWQAYLSGLPLCLLLQWPQAYVVQRSSGNPLNAMQHAQDGGQGRTQHASFYAINGYLNILLAHAFSLGLPSCMSGDRNVLNGAYMRAVPLDACGWGQAARVSPGAAAGDVWGRRAGSGLGHHTQGPTARHTGPLIL
jgi:hypothetical protein